MSKTSKINWTEKVWNPLTGCTKISPGCANCYAERLSIRLKGNPKLQKYKNGFELTLHESDLKRPLTWNKPHVIFTNSMSDLFHKDVPDKFIHQVFDTMVQAHWHTFQILTKRSDRLANMAAELPWPDNIWMGVSVENHRYLYRIDHLRSVPAKVRFISAEPLLGTLVYPDPGPVNHLLSQELVMEPFPITPLNLDGIHWVIVGGESGDKFRPMDLHWAREIREECARQNVPFFFKQVGGRTSKAGGRLLDGQEYNGMPAGFEGAFDHG